MNSADEVEISFLANPSLPFKVESVEGIGLRLTGLPSNKPSELCTSMKIKFKKEPKLIEGAREINKAIRLDALGAQIGNVRMDDFDSKPCINWYNGRQIKYKILITHSGLYKICGLHRGWILRPA